MMCDICYIEFEDEFNLEIHNIKKHKDVKVTCLICNKKYKSITHHLKGQHKDEYEKHKKEKTVDELYENGENNKCKFCDYIGWSQHLIRHIVFSTNIIHYS